MILTWTILAIAIGLLAQYLWKLATVGYDIFEKQGIPFIKPLPLFGTMFPLVARQATPTNFFKKVVDRFPSAKVIGLFQFKAPVYFITDLELIKQIMVKDFEHFINHQMKPDAHVDPVFGNALFALDDLRWKDMRTTLSPAFTGSKMRQMFTLIPEIANQMVKYFSDAPSRGQEIEMRQTFSKVALDIIASTNFGITMNSLEHENEFTKVVRRMIDFSTFRVHFALMSQMFMPYLAKLLNLRIVQEKNAKFISNLVQETERVREKHGITRPDVISLLMQIKKGQLNLETSESDDAGFATVQESDIEKTVKVPWKSHELDAQAFIFLFAGYEALTTTITFTSYALATNPDVQEKLFEEVNSVTGDLTYETMQKLKYLDMVVSEVLRVYTPADLADRECAKDYTFKNDQGQDVTIAKGSLVWVPIVNFHMSDKYFENPEKFDPERFSDENKHKITAGSYMPFGIGPRNCIGSRYALMTAKAVMFYIVKHFKIETNAKTQIPLTFMKVFFGIKMAEKGVWLNIVPRK